MLFNLFSKNVKDLLVLRIYENILIYLKFLIPMRLHRRQPIFFIESKIHPFSVDAYTVSSGRALSTKTFALVFLRLHNFCWLWARFMGNATMRAMSHAPTAHPNNHMCFMSLYTVFMCAYIYLCSHLHMHMCMNL